MTVEYSRLGSRAILFFTANGSANIVGNSAASNTGTISDIAVGSEQVNSASISEVWWGTQGNAFWTVARGGNTVLVLNNSGHMQFAERGGTLYGASPNNLLANLVVTITGGTTLTGFIRIGLQKSSFANLESQA